jgi:hypothetical protein
MCLLAGATAAAEEISAARYVEPSRAYGHFALGSPHEYAAIAVDTDRGRTLRFALPAGDVFEDIAPRPLRLARGDPPQLLTVASNGSGGSRLVLLELRPGGIAVAAQSAPIGTPMRWLNPVGAADLDGDGEKEIAAVITPHIGGILKVYRRHGTMLAEIAALPGFSNHVYGSTTQDLSLALDIGGHARLVVPDASRRVLRIIALEGDKLVETGRCLLDAPITGGLRQEARQLAWMQGSGRVTRDPTLCKP